MCTVIGKVSRETGYLSINIIYHEEAVTYDQSQRRRNKLGINDTRHHQRDRRIIIAAITFHKVQWSKRALTDRTFATVHVRLVSLSRIYVIQKPERMSDMKNKRGTDAFGIGPGMNSRANGPLHCSQCNMIIVICSFTTDNCSFFFISGAPIARRYFQYFFFPFSSVSNFSLRISFLRGYY